MGKRNRPQRETKKPKKKGLKETKPALSPSLVTPTVQVVPRKRKEVLEERPK